MQRILAGVVLALVAAAPAPAQELRGHGGPVRALSVSADGSRALSGSFDSSAIVWDIAAQRALVVLRLHDSAVNATAFLPDGRLATAGQDGRIAIWPSGGGMPVRVVGPLDAPVSSLAVSPDGRFLAAGVWDGSVLLVALGASDAITLRPHRGPVSAVAFSPDGTLLYSGGHDGVLGLTPIARPESGRTVQVGSTVSAVVVARDGSILTAGADVFLRTFSPDGTAGASLALAETPIVALGLSDDGATVAGAALRGTVTLVDRATMAVTARLVGPGLPVWSVVFRPGARELLTGGGDRLVRRWNATTGEHLGPVVMERPADPLSAFANDPGAEIYRACIACHTLDAADGPRAGPTLQDVIGRRIGTAPGFDFSPALRAMDIVWTEETIARLFEIGPNAYTPGTKMPEQIVGDPVDRAALAAFIARFSRPR